MTDPGKKILIVYSTTDGHAREIAGRIGALLRQHGHGVAVVDVLAPLPAALADHDFILIGASIRYGHHSREICRFIKRHARDLASRANAFFSVNAVARKPHKRQADTNPYVRKFLRRIPWQPQMVEVFAGKIDYPRYGPVDRAVIRFIMWLTGGPTDPKSVTDFTDWQQVDDFAQRVAAALGSDLESPASGRG